MITIDSKGIAILLKLTADALPDSKIEQIKAIREVLGLGLKESKDLVEAEHVRRNPIDPVLQAIQRIAEDLSRAKAEVRRKRT